MKKASYLFAMALALGYLAYSGRASVAVVAFGWSSFSFGLTAAAYARLIPNPFLKQADGRLSKFTIIMLWPYLVLTWLIFHIATLISKEEPLTMIHNRLLLGRRLSGWEAGKLAYSGVQSVLDLTCEFPESYAVRKNRAYLNMPILDDTAPTVSQLSKGVHWLEDRVKDGPVFVHCAQGHGRSAAFVAAYLLHAGIVQTVAEAVCLIANKRPGIKLRRDAQHNIAASKTMESFSASVQRPR